MTPAERAVLLALYYAALAVLAVRASGRVAGAARTLVAELCRELEIVNPYPTRDDRRAARVVQ